MTTAALSRGAWSPVTRYRRSLWLLTTRDLKVRYSTSFLGYFWSILDPLVMAAIYWFVFTKVFGRPVGYEPYIVFLLGGLLPWMWFTGAVSDCTRAFTRESKLIRSTTIPRTIWVARLVLSKGIILVIGNPCREGRVGRVIRLSRSSGSDGWSSGGQQLSGSERDRRNGRNCRKERRRWGR